MKFEFIMPLTFIYPNKISYHNHELPVLDFHLAPQATTKLTVDNDKNYDKFEQIAMEIGHYHAELKEFNNSIDNGDSQINNTAKKPVITQIGKMYDIPETTLCSHIKNPRQQMIVEANVEKQLLTKGEEEVLVKRLLFLDDFYIPTNKALSACLIFTTYKNRSFYTNR
jgi:hypothetical protein